ncbi:glycosyltransferase [Atlantibacter sp.]|uniref:glycosyltransferase n=1 Tax=Atlantibacter sp. TaxID=1903473 RepID=UPI00289810AD|nr:glycosyltransferase [Atlantibacter sp.]
MNKPAELTISLVVYKPLMKQLSETLQSLALSLSQVDVSYHIYVIDNTPESEFSAVNEKYLSTFFSHNDVSYIRKEQNVGFGKAHNFTVGLKSTFHLVLNPDLTMDKDAIEKSIQYLLNNKKCGLLTPYVTWSDGKVQRLCKNYPSVFILLLRGFAPKIIRRLFKAKLNKYEMVDEINDHTVFINPPMVSGCFMFFRTEVWNKCGGFDSRYFLYFEDFDLSIRVKEISQIAYVPEVKIIHHGGFAARKGIKHIILFFKSMMLFFNTHQWKWF